MVGLKYFNTNARMLRNKKDKLFTNIMDEDLGTVCITEAWINEKFKENSKEYDVDGYTRYLNQRADRKGGCVVICVRNTFPSIQVRYIIFFF